MRRARASGRCSSRDLIEKPSVCDWQTSSECPALRIPRAGEHRCHRDPAPARASTRCARRLRSIRRCGCSRGESVPRLHPFRERRHPDWVEACRLRSGLPHEMTANLTLRCGCRDDPNIGASVEKTHEDELTGRSQLSQAVGLRNFVRTALFVPVLIRNAPQIQSSDRQDRGVTRLWTIHR